MPSDSRYKMAEQKKNMAQPRLMMSPSVPRLVCLTGGEEGVLAASFPKAGKQGPLDIENLVSIFGNANVFV